MSKKTLESEWLEFSQTIALPDAQTREMLKGTFYIGARQAFYLMDTAMKDRRFDDYVKLLEEISTYLNSFTPLVVVEQ